MHTEKRENSLIHEKSPYLLQHAYNPVQWMPWGEKALALAKEQDKLIIVSIGYSACHWCHVMEKETFEDENAAQIMNDFFINIKVDREERPDIDQVYMSAVQLMTGHGGWPLNCILLPDGRPIYGGTYFPNLQWRNVLMNLVKLFRDDREKVEKYANELTSGILKADLIQIQLEENELKESFLKKAINEWVANFDNEHGGSDRAPKFPMPANYKFLLQYSHLCKDENIRQHVYLTLNKMASGGIYDQLQGGFARYSVDALWKIPHFEKMLYDNAQLVSLYAEAYQESKNELYLEIIQQTLEFIEKEFSHPNGGWYSALDADTEGEEGKYYTWTKEEINEILTEEEFQTAEKYFCLDERAYWEHDKFVLLREESFPMWKNHSHEKAEVSIQAIKEKLLHAREKRSKPGLDDKILSAWNALMIKAYLDAYKATSNKQYLQKAEAGLSFIRKHLMRENGSLFHAWKKGEAYINGFLDDYAFTLEAFISYYELNGDEFTAKTIHQITEFVLQHFSDSQSDFFFYTSDEDPELLSRKIELNDNVIPSSNSQMANNLFRLGILFEEEKYSEKAMQMMKKIIGEIPNYPQAYGNWGILCLKFIYPGAEIVIVGKDVDVFSTKMNKHYLPNCIFALSKNKSDYPLFKNRYSDKETKAYICRNKTCLAPIENENVFNDAIEKINI